MTAAIKRRLQSEGVKHYFSSLLFSLYTMRRPLDGFWDLIHEKRGSMAAAHTIVIVHILVLIIYLTQSNFWWIDIPMEGFNAMISVMNVMLPLVLFTIANWCLTTLFDGKGRMRDIYMGYAYALVPQTLIYIVTVPLTYILTAEEVMIPILMWRIGELWFVVLVLCAMKQIHDYTFGKAIITTLATLFAAGVMVFIFLMFFAVVSDGFAYFYSIGQEALFRIRRG